MDVSINKTKKAQRGVEEEVEEMETAPSSRGHSRSSSISSVTDEAKAFCPRTPTKRRKLAMKELQVSLERSPKSLRKDVVQQRQLENCTLEEVRKERWANLEGKLQEQILENEKLKLTQQHAPKVPSYAQMASSPRSQLQGLVPEKEKKIINKETYEVVIIKPEKEEDSRSNEELKTQLTNKLKDVRKQLKVKSVRQMRRKGLVMEIKDKKDVELIKSTKLEEIGLKLEKPKKILPSIIIYDVERENKVDELKEEFITKNFDCSEKDLEELQEKVSFRTNYVRRVEVRICYATLTCYTR
ncbi:BICD family-like cargo adapter 1 [Colletes gigas]|uniref:BICD family-like cargo adapter 1 n=1 Tax=Colletes gigas TaxID=935657 RepID=UPI001C9A4E15|nr:BICD family-like cargo adapter 1 [Colletes gigas]